jgi:hypothetical protein
LIISTEKNTQYVSPTVLLKDDVYYMWVVDSGGCSSSDGDLIRYQSYDGINWNWDNPTPNDLNLEEYDLTIWHPEIKYIEEFQEYWMVFSAHVSSGSCNICDTYFAKSENGIDWTFYDEKIALKKKDFSGWDRGGIYKSTFLYDQLTNKLKVWYSANSGGSEMEWNTGYVEEDYDVFIKRLDSNLTKWQQFKIQSEDMLVDIDNNELTLEAKQSLSSSANLRSTKKILSNNIVIELKQKVTDNSYVNTSIGNMRAEDSHYLCYDQMNPNSYWNTLLCFGYFFASYGNKWIISYASTFGVVNKINGGGSGYVYAPPINTYAKIKYVYTDDGNTLWYYNDQLITHGDSLNTNYLNTEKYLLLSQGEYENGAGGTRTVDYIFLREYSNEDPVISCSLSSPPTTIATGQVDGWINEDQTITLSCSDDAGCYKTFYRINESSWEELNYDTNQFVISLDGNNQVDYYSLNINDEEEEIKTIFVAIDKTSPVITDVSNVDSWFNSDFNISFVVDYGVSEKDSATYSLNDGNFTSFVSDYNVLISEDGNHSIEYSFIDNAGNKTTDVVYGLLDKTSPVITDVNVLDITKNSANIKVLIEDENEVRCRLSDQNVSFISMSEGTEKTGLENVLWGLSSLTNDTNYIYYFVCVDVADNNSDINSVSFKTEKTTLSSSGSSTYIPPQTTEQINSTTGSLVISSIDDIKNTLLENDFDFENKEIFIDDSKLNVIRKATGSILNDSQNINFEIVVQNKTDQEKEVSIIEIIPKNIVDHVDKISFEFDPTDIINPDPIVVWNITLSKNSEININYSVQEIEDENILENINLFLDEWHNPLLLVPVELTESKDENIVPLDSKENYVDEFNDFENVDEISDVFEDNVENNNIKNKKYYLYFVFVVIFVSVLYVAIKKKIHSKKIFLNKKKLINHSKSKKPIKQKKLISKKINKK